MIHWGRFLNRTAWRGQEKSKKTSRPKATGFILHIPLHSAGDSTGTEASGADANVSGGALHDRLHALHVGLPGAVGTTVGVRYPDTESDALVAEFAFGHVAYLLAMKIAYKKASTDIVAEIPAKCKDFFKKRIEEKKEEHVG